VDLGNTRYVKLSIIQQYNKRWFVIRDSMKLLIQTTDGVKVKTIKEYELGETISSIKSNYAGQEVNPLKYEVFRYKLPKGAIVIFNDNRILRARNEWFEYRALAALARKYGEFKHGVQFKKAGFQTEVDGVSLDEKILVEIKRDKITQTWVDFYTQKLKKLEFKELILVAADFEESLKYPASITPVQFVPDWETIQTYYRNFRFPEWIQDLVSSRHFRFLLPNGRWQGAKRKFTQTAKHSLESKFSQAIQWLKYWMPVKIYYTMSRMVNPPREYYGKGYPLPHLLAVFDIDAESHSHIIGTKGFCERCISEATAKTKAAEAILKNEGYAIKTVFSGKKGFHLYIMQDDKVKEVNSEEFFQILQKVKDYTDSISFRDRNDQFDLHRIIKVPYTIDASTGMLVSEEIQKLNLKDLLNFL